MQTVMIDLYEKLAVLGKCAVVQLKIDHGQTVMNNTRGQNIEGESNQHQL